ncbi:PspE Rhodanese-related sulfurtransferase [Rhabdaerophilaceae bacterium]
MMIVDLNREAIKSGLARGDMLIVDVREPNEFAAGHIPGSISMPLSTFDPDELPRSEGLEIVLSCAAGVRSRHALMIAQAAGRAISAHYVGGFKDWAIAGEEIAYPD